MSKTFRSGATSTQRETIRKILFEIVDQLAKQTGLPHEAVVLEIRYFHQSASNPYRTTASEKDKKTSLEVNGRKCQFSGCNEPLTLSEAVFHHLERGCRDQHGPHNLLPYCEKCHDEEHDAVGASLAKGSRKRIT